MFHFSPQFSIFMLISNILLFYHLSLYALYFLFLFSHCAMFDLFPSLSLSAVECHLIFKGAAHGFLWLVLNCVLLSHFTSFKVLDKLLIINERLTTPWDLELVFRALEKVSFEPLELSLIGSRQSIRSNPKTNHLGLPLANNLLKTNIRTQKLKSLSLHKKS